MKIKDSTNPYVQIISGLLSFVFLFQQIAWAGDIGTFPATRENPEISHAGSQPGQFLERTNTHKELVENKNMLEQLMMNFSQEAPEQFQKPIRVHIPEGHIVGLQDNIIAWLETDKNHFLENIVLAEESILEEADIAFGDGVMITLKNGEIVNYTDPVGNSYRFDFLGQIVNFKNSSDIEWDVQSKSNGGILLSDGFGVATYDTGGILKKVEYRSGKIIYFDEGRLERVVESGGEEYFFSEEITPEGNVIVQLSSIRKKGNTYYVEDNRIITIELADGTYLEKFIIDKNGELISGRVNFNDGTGYTLEHGKVIELRKPDGVEVRYTYTSDNEVVVDLSEAGKKRTMKYSRDHITGEMTIREGMQEYLFSPDGQLMSFLAEEGEYEYFHDPHGKRISTVLTTDDGTRVTYDADNILLSSRSLCGEDRYFFTSGEHKGRVKRAIFPRGDSYIYEYEGIPGQDLAVKKWSEYEGLREHVHYYGKDHALRTRNPSFMGSFTLDPDKVRAHVMFGANSYGPGEKRVNMNVYVQGEKAFFYFYSYDFNTRAVEKINKELDLVVEKGEEYVAEYVWQDHGVDVFIYASSSERPGTPTFRLDDNEWDPRFYLSGTNAQASVASKDSDMFNVHKNYNTDYRSDLQDPFKTRMEFNFDAETSRNHVYLRFSGQDRLSYDSLRLSMRNGEPVIIRDRYDQVTRKKTSNSIFTDLSLKPGITYVIEAEVDHDHILQIHMYEKGDSLGDAVYLEDECKWVTGFYGNVSGGESNIEVYHDMELAELSTEGGLYFPEELPDSADRISSVIEPAYPHYAREHPDIELFRNFPDGMIDITEGKEIDAFLTPGLPRNQFDKRGELKRISGDRQEGYYHVFEYDISGGIKSIVSPDGEVRTYDQPVNESPLVPVNIQLIFPEIDKGALLKPVLEALEASMDYFDGKTFYESGRVRTELLSDGVIVEYSDEDRPGQPFGRIVRESTSSGAWKTFEYHGNTDTLRKKSFYLPDGTLYSVRVFSGSAEMVSERIYYEDGQLKEIRRSDSTWERYDEVGELLFSGETTEAGDIVYEKSGRIMEISKGGIVEKRLYVELQGEVEYTIALRSGEVSALFKGYFDSPEFLFDGSLFPKEEISVTYGYDTAINYSDGSLSSYSVDGFVNFFSENGLFAQRDSHGSLYSYTEDGYLESIATPSGNIYSFETSSSSQGVIVELKSSIIDGKLVRYEGLSISSILNDRSLNHIVGIDLNSRLEIKELFIDNGSGPQEQFRGTELFDMVGQVLTSIKNDIANIGFFYGEDGFVKEIVTSNYSKIFFDGKRIKRTRSVCGIETNYEYLQAEEGLVTGLRVSEPGTTRTYDASGSLVSIMLDGDNEIVFDGGELSGIFSNQSSLTDITFNNLDEISSARLINGQGAEYFFVGGNLKSFMDDQQVTYDVDQEGRITNLKRMDSGDEFEVSYAQDEDTGRDLTIFTDVQRATRYIYEYCDRCGEELLNKVIDRSGLIVKYQYGLSGKITSMEILLGGMRTVAYEYGYSNQGVTISDDVGYVRHYDDGGRALKVETPYGETYLYDYPTDQKGQAITVVNYSTKVKSDGTEIEYFKGKIVEIREPDGTVVRNVKFDPYTRKLSGFSVITPDGKYHDVVINGDLVELKLEDSTRLVFFEDRLVAFGNSQGVTALYDIAELEEMAYVRNHTEGAEDTGEIDVASSNWRYQTYNHSQGVNFVERDYALEQWQVRMDMDSSNERTSQGEMYLDLRHDIPGLNWQAPIDMEGKEISFLFKPDEAFEFTPGASPEIEVFAKDQAWRTQYGPAVSIERYDDWVKVSLRPGGDDITLGYTDHGFDPASVTMIGIRLRFGEEAVLGDKFSGTLKIKHDILPDLFENVNYMSSPLDPLYRSLGLTRNLALLTSGDDFLEEEAYLESFLDALGRGPSDIFQKNMLNMIVWTPEEGVEDVRGIRSVHKKPETNEYVVTVELSSSSEKKSKGEMYFGLEGSLPGLEWDSSMNLTGRPISMLVKVPDGLIGPENNPNGARLFVEDSKGQMQYGTWVNLKESEKWYRMDITPTFGSIPNGTTHPDFDPSLITRIGVSIVTPPASGTDFKGDLHVKFLPKNLDVEAFQYVNMPLWSDLRGLREYLKDINDNYIRVPKVTYLPEEYYSYVFNQGSGEVPEIAFDAIENAGNSWTYYGKHSWEGQLSNQAVTSVRWSEEEQALLAEVDVSSGGTGEIYLDLRHIPHSAGRNWQRGSTLDMTTREVSFYVRAKQGFVGNTAVPLQLEAMAKSVTNSGHGEVWRDSYGRNVSLDLAGEWVKVTITPSPYDFNHGISHSDFDPTNVALLGLRVKPLSRAYSYSGELEIKYDVNGLDMGIGRLEDDGVMPAGPVWVDQRKIVKYIKNAGIDLYADHGTMGVVKRSISSINSAMLPQDMAAFKVYNENGDVRSVTKPDGTTAWFDREGKLSQSTFENGDIFVDYKYDSEGILISARLVSARTQLREAMDEVLSDFHKNAADSLIVLAEQYALLEEDFMEDVLKMRGEFARVRRRLRGQQYTKVTHRFLFIKWTEKVENKSVTRALRDLARKEAQFNLQVAEQLALLNDELADEMERIERERQEIVAEYRWQEEKILLGILKKEALPMIHYHYRRVLGRDATVEETVELLGRYLSVDSYYDHPELRVSDISNWTEFVESLVLKKKPYIYAELSEEVKLFLAEYAALPKLGEAEKLLLLSGMNELVFSVNLYSVLESVFGEALLSSDLLSEETLLYAKDLGDLAQIEMKDAGSSVLGELEWLNRYILEDIYDGIFVSDSPRLREERGSFAAFFLEEIKSPEDVAMRIKENIPALVYDALPERTRVLVRDYEAGDVLTEEERFVLLSGLDGLLRTYDLFLQFKNHYGSEKALREVLSERTNTYLDEMGLSGSGFGDPDFRQRRDVEWLNRYILEDLFPGITRKEKNAKRLSSRSLKEELRTSEERFLSETFMGDVIDSVTEFFRDYLENPAKRAETLAFMGFSEDEVIEVTEEFIDALLSWLEGQDLHFGRSAFGALKRMLEILGPSVDMEQVAREAIIIDILVGAGGPLSGKDLEISLYALKKTAELHGVFCAAARVNYLDIQQFDEAFITLINERHYVTVVSVSSVEVVYWDQNMGRSGGVVSISREEFEKNWQGNVLATGKSLEEAVSGRAEAGGIEELNILSGYEAKRIRGGFWWFIPMAISFVVKAVTTVVAAAVSLIGSLVSGVTSFLTSIVGGLAKAVMNVGSMVKLAGESFFGTMGLGGAVSGAAGGAELASGFSIGALVEGASGTLVKAGVAYGVGSGLEILGVDPVVSGLVSSIVTGGIHGLMMQGGFQEAFNSAIRFGVATGAQLLGQHFDLDPVIAGIVSMSSSMLTGSILDPEMPIKEVIGSIVQNVAGELGYYGISFAGRIMGVNAQISDLAGIGIRSSLRAGLGTFGLGGGSPGNWLDGLQDGLLRGITSVGLQLGSQAVDFPPLVGVLTSNMIGSVIEGALNQKNVFINLTDHLTEGIISTLRLGGFTNDPWSQAVYASKLMDFTGIVKERGVLTALETYSTAIFHQHTIDMIIRDGGIVDMVTGRAEIITDPYTGRDIKRLWTDKDRSYYLDVDLETGAMVEKKERINGKVVIFRQRYFEDNNGRLLPEGLVVTEIFEDNTRRVSEYDSEGGQIRMEIFDAEGDVVLVRTPISTNGNIAYDENGVPLSCIEEDMISGVKYKIEGGDVSELLTELEEEVPKPTYERDETKTDLENAVSYLDNKIDHIYDMVYDGDVMASDAYSRFMKSLIVSNSQYQMAYGNEFNLLTGSLDEYEQEQLMNYLGMRTDILLNPYDYVETPSEQQLLEFEKLQNPSGEVDFVMGVIHGIKAKESGWASHLEDIPINEQNFMLAEITWNTLDDDIPGSGLTGYMFDSVTRGEIIDNVKRQISRAWREAQAQDNPLDLTAHSLGTVITYEALKELAVESPEIRVRNLNLMGSPLPFFIDKGLATYDADDPGFSNVHNVVNIYNPGDGMNMVKAVPEAIAAFGALMVFNNPFLIQRVGTDPVSRAMRDYFPGIEDVSLLVPHSSMWIDSRMLKEIEKNAQFD